ncbi:hypothetical protein KAR10_09350 [bacterium]|nr:hypothetical protein [bacterium]
MKCDNYEEGSSEKCRYFEALQGSGEDLPTGCDPSNGDCLVIQKYTDWVWAEDEDCDMLDTD